MAKQKKEMLFIVGGNLPDGTRFEAGDAVPGDLTPAVMRSLKDNGCIGEAAEIEAVSEESE